MTPDEVVKKINSSRTTLLRFLHRKLIPEPRRGGDGRGKGRFTEYPDDTPDEFFAAVVLLSTPYRLSYDEVAECRSLALNIVQQDPKDEQVITEIATTVYDYLVTHNMECLPMWFFWWKLKLLSQHNCEVVWLNETISPNIEVPQGLNILYDKITKCIDNLIQKREVRIVFDQSCKVRSQEKWISYLGKQLKEKYAELEKEKAKFNKLYNWSVQLNKQDIDYLNKLYRVYWRKPSLRSKLEEIIKERYCVVSNDVIPILQDKAKRYDEEQEKQKE